MCQGEDNEQRNDNSDKKEQDNKSTADKASANATATRLSPKSVTSDLSETLWKHLTHPLLRMVPSPVSSKTVAGQAAPASRRKSRRSTPSTFVRASFSGLNASTTKPIGTQLSSPLKTLRLVCFTVPVLLLNLLQLLLAVICLAPGFVHFAWYYWKVAHHITIQYAPASCRQRLDVYPSTNTSTTTTTTTTTTAPLSPVVVFLPGGGWMIGYKMWGAFLARSLQAVSRNRGGCTVVMVDYRNYPLAPVPDQVADVQDAMMWVQDHIVEFGGDPNQIVLVGESAGGHLGIMYLLLQQQQQQAAHQEPQLHSTSSTSSTNSLTSTDSSSSSSSKTASSPSVKGFISMSAPFDIRATAETFARHGLDEDGILDIFADNGINHNLQKYDPLFLVQQHDNTSASKQQQELPPLTLPPMMICHGTKDKTVPVSSATKFYQALQEAGKKDVTLRIYQGWTHTRGNVEGPIDGDYTFHQDVWKMIQLWTAATSNNNDNDNNNNDDEKKQLAALQQKEEKEVWRQLGQLCPSLLVQLGSFFMPV